MVITVDGGMVLFICQKDEERQWLEENTTAEGWQWLGEHALAVEARYAGQVVRGAREAGFL